MEDLRAIVEGVLLLLTSLLVHVWADVFPVVTAITAMCAAVLALHGVIRLLWRWSHGINTLSDCDGD